MGKTISILGCGWLGFSLAKELLKAGNVVNGSTTTLENFYKFEQAGIIPFQISETTGLPMPFFQVDVIIICIPPSGKEFIAQFKKIVSAINNSICERIIFTSSTSVYSQVEGLCNEYSLTLGQSPNSEKLLFAEKLLMDLSKSKRIAILRLAGLIGEDRHPGKFFLSKNSIPNANQVVNLVVREDVIRFIQLIIQRDFYHLFNVCADQHPSKKDFYSAAILKLGLELPEFTSTEKVSTGKIIDNDKSKSRLGFKYQYADLMKWVKS